jgi:hypothetical protein
MKIEDAIEATQQLLFSQISFPAQGILAHIAHSILTEY